MKKFISAAIGLLLVLGVSLALPSDPVNAMPDASESVESPERVLHNYDAWSQYYCIKHRPSNTAVNHSWPYALGPNFVGYWCHAASLSSGASWQYWVDVYGGPGSPYSVQPWDYQKCNPGGIVWCGTAGH